ncbi:hypothetical protein Fmac_013126 [Flemingia macrophylla]|uniref:Uncharacterized protein n=1 Tax=Flemingia macrophylla TaxID=520843 RepID=A0ABD1MSA6_9FABA
MMARLISISNANANANAKTPTLLLLQSAIRHRSSEAFKSKWVEIDGGVKLFEEHAHHVMVKQATPDWLPFRPGSSFWVPPPPSPFHTKFSVFHKFQFESQSQSQSQSLATSQVTVQLKLLAPSENVTLSEDEEG